MAKFQTKVFDGKTPIILCDSAKPELISVPIEFGAIAPIANDVHELCELPIGARCLDWTLVLPDIDSNATPLYTASLGVMNAGFTDLDTEVWGSNLQGGRTGAVDRNTTGVASQGVITTQRRIGLKTTAAAATYSGSGKVGHLLMLIQQ